MADYTLAAAVLCSKKDFQGYLEELVAVKDGAAIPCVGDQANSIEVLKRKVLNFESLKQLNTEPELRDAWVELVNNFNQFLAGARSARGATG